MVRRVFVELRAFWRHLAGLFFLGLLETPLLLLTPIPLKIAVDSVVGSRPAPGWLEAIIPGGLTGSDGAVLVAAAVFQVLVVVLVQAQVLGAEMLRVRTGERLTLSLRSKLFAHLQRLSFSFHDTRGTSDSIYRIQYDAQMIQHLAVSALIPLITSGVALLAMIYVTARLDWQLALVALGVSPFLFALGRRYRRRMRPRYRQTKELESSALNVVQEVLTSLRVVKAFGREESEEERFLGRSSEGMRARVRLAYSEGIYGLLVNLVTAVGTAAVLLMGTRSVQSGRLSLGELLMVIVYLSQLYSPLKVLSKIVGTIQSSLASAERVFEVLDEVPDVRERADARPLARASGAIEFRDVSFAYDGENAVLENVSFSIPPGARVGIAGRTGAGKTTLASLVGRFYDPTSGQILLDGVDLRDYRLADLRNQFAIVLQEPVLFSTSIGENIAYGRPEAGQEEVEAAAKAAGVHDFIAGLPEGYDTLVGERGLRLSGGERQRVSLARAFLKDAPILILDEPTSSVDLRTEALIMEATRRLMEKRTTLLIAHRLSTLESCDLRAEVEDGRLVFVLSPQAQIATEEGQDAGLSA